MICRPVFNVANLLALAAPAPCARATALAAAAELTATALLGIAAGSLFGASIVLLPLAAWAGPAHRF
ncbi:hypothetical protein [Mycetohabitans endofungorum]|uniref:hypothetical protein n=1 Tax=Mycetohabitans endofungorum TaxID=417203 RepID=UPI0030D15DB4